MCFKKEAEKQYDESARNLTTRKCTMIYLVVFYILYQAYGIVDSKLMNETTMTWTGVILGAGILIVGSLAVAVYATIKMGQELAESEITEEIAQMDKNEYNENDKNEINKSEINENKNDKNEYNENDDQ